MAVAATLLAGLVGGAATAHGVEVERGVEWTTIVRHRPAERINVLTVEPGRVRAVLSNNRVARRERVSSMGERVEAVAGVNGGFFAPSGDPVGVLAIDGELVSEPVDGRSALIIPPAAPTPAAPRIAPVRYRGRITVNGRSREIDGINRTRGLIPACGGRGGDLPTIRPNSVLTCTDSSELVLLSPRYGARPPAEGGVEAIVRDGVVTRVRPPGVGGVPRRGVLLTGTGDAARFLRNVALPRSRAEVVLRVTAGGERLDLRPGEGGERLDLRPGDGEPAGETIVGGGPRILRAGRVVVAAKAEGFAPLRAFFQSFVAGRQPRTLAGVRADGALLLVTVDGRAPGWSAGMTLPEAARLMRSLGARDAVNLDGGGSSTMTVRGEVVNRPSDRVERAVSDGLFVMP
ncbi:MAG TPA: phosphodiester glycosidase family protein [Gaiellaceae bacterium]|nr:phosphodiester glycosidase family protein [Gaiellaceae bacterium]